MVDKAAQAVKCGRRVMATSRHKQSVDRRRRALIEQLVFNLTDLPQQSPNFKKAVEFSVGNINDHTFLVPAPSLVRGQYKRLLEKLELHSQVSKHAALSQAIELLQSRKFVRDQWEKEEILYSKLCLLYHLADRVLEYSPSCEIQIRLFHAQRKGEVSDDTVIRHAEQIRAIAAEYKDDDPQSDDNSETDDEFVTYEESVQKRARGILDEFREVTKVGSDDASFLVHDKKIIDAKSRNYNLIDSSPAGKGANLNPPSLGIVLPPQLRSEGLAGMSCDPCALLTRSHEISALPHNLSEEVAHECTVVREVITMLSGLGGRIFTIGEVDAPIIDDSPQSKILRLCFQLRRPVSVLHLSTSSLQSFLDFFIGLNCPLRTSFVNVANATPSITIRMGSDLLRLRRLSSAMIASGPRTLQALFSGAADHLSAMDQLLARLLHAAAPSSVPLPDGSRSRLTLLALESVLRPRFQVLQVICRVAKTVVHPLRDKASAGQLAQHALETLRQAAGNAQTTPDALPGRVLRRLYVTAMEPYVAFLEAWLYEGSLKGDARGEFFIRSVECDEEGDGEAGDISAAASAYWQQFDMRDGGSVVHMGTLRAGSKSQLLLDSSASAIDEFYTGMTVTVQLSDTGAKRKAEVVLETAPAANDKFVISTVVPLFLQPLASQILSAGKSLNVLLLDPETRHEMRHVLCEKPRLVSAFRAQMRAVDASTARNTLLQSHSSTLTSNFPSLQANKSTEVDRNLVGDGISDADDSEDQHSLVPTAPVQDLNQTAMSDALILTDSHRDFGELQLLDRREEVSSLPNLFTEEDGTDPRSRSRIANTFRSRHNRGLTGSSLRSLFGPQQTGNDRAPAVLHRTSSLDLPMRLETVPFGLLVEQGFMREVAERVQKLNLALVTLLRGRFQLHTHLAALRRVFFMAAGDVLHVFALSLFEKLDSAEPWNDGHSLNTTLQSSLPPIPGVSYGTVTAYTAEVHQTQRVQLRKGEDTSINALDGLRLHYTVGWPLNLVINERTMGIYNDILLFLLQIKRAKCALDRDFKTEKQPYTSTVGDGARRRKSAAWLRAPNTKHVLLRVELRHVVNNVENYIMTQIHGDATRELEQEVAAAGTLDDVIAAHARFLHKMRDRCLLHQRAAVVADTIRKVLDLALQFQVAYPQFQRLQVLSQVGDQRLERHSNRRALEEELERMAGDFRRCTRLLIVVLEKIVSRGFHPHLEDLLVRLSFNRYYAASTSTDSRP